MLMDQACDAFGEAVVKLGNISFSALVMKGPIPT